MGEAPEDATSPDLPILVTIDQRAVAVRYCGYWICVLTLAEPLKTAIVSAQ